MSTYIAVQVGTSTYWAIIIQSYVGGWMILSRFASVLLIPLGDALTIIFSAPIFTTILAKIFLGHKLKSFRC